MYWGCGLETLVTQVLDWLCPSYLVLVSDSFWRCFFFFFFFFLGGGGRLEVFPMEGSI